MSLYSGLKIYLCEFKKEEKSYTETVTKGIFNCDLKNAIWRPFKAYFKIQILLEYRNKGNMQNE